MFLLKSFIYPIFSSEYYKEAYQKGIKKAFLVYAVFTLVVAIVTGAIFTINSLKGLDEFIKDAKDFPKITVSDGTLTVEDMDKPVEYSNEGQYIAIDTTGTLTDFPDKYAEGFMFLKDKILYRSRNVQGIQTISYDQILKELDRDSIIITAADVQSWVTFLNTFLILIAPFAVFFWNFLFRLIPILIVAGIGSVVLNTAKAKYPFRKSFIITMYASIPVFYVSFLLSVLSKVSFVTIVMSACCLLPLTLWIAKWGVFWWIGASQFMQEKVRLKK